MTIKPDEKYVTNNRIVGLLILLALGVGGFFLTDVLAQIRTLQVTKVDKEQYKCDMTRIEGKLDKIIDMHTKGLGKE